MPDPLLVPLRTVCRMLGISETTYFRFRRCGADVPAPVASPHRRLLFAAVDIEACVERWKRASRLHVVERKRRAARAQLKPHGQPVLRIGGDQ
jgi:predicted DNA-binding transcriptional regulator AlpA